MARRSFFNFTVHLHFLFQLNLANLWLLLPDSLTARVSCPIRLIFWNVAFWDIKNYFSDYNIIITNRSNACWYWNALCTWLFSILRVTANSVGCASANITVSSGGFSTILPLVCGQILQMWENSYLELQLGGCRVSYLITCKYCLIIRLILYSFISMPMSQKSVQFWAVVK